MPTPASARRWTGVRDDLRPIADDLRSSTTSLRDLSGSSDELVAQLAALDEDLTQLDTSLDQSTVLLETYRADTAEAIALAQDSLDDLDRDIALSRALAVVLALSIAVGQVAPFHIGRELARGGSTRRRSDRRSGILVARATRNPTRKGAKVSVR